MVGETLLHYRLLGKVGEGGMGVVYKALDTHLDRPVAIKVLPAAKIADPDRKRRFIQEAKAASALNHPNIVTVYDIASDRGVDFMVMEFVEGQTLDGLIGRHGMKLGDALSLAVQAADGLARAHAAGIVHRDLKPTNIIVTPEGRVKILDFGLAKLVETSASGAPGPTLTVREAERPATEEGFVMGTAAYMSPEQAEGRPVDARSDIFSFGAVLYEMLTGQRAFRRDSPIATLAAVLHEEPRPAGKVNESVPPEVEAVLVRCLRKDPARRFQTMSDLKVVLQDLKEDSDSGKLRAAAARPEARKARVPWPIAAGFLLLIAAGAGWLIFFKKGPAPPPEFEIMRLTYDAGATVSSAVSRDGMMFAYASDRAGNGDLDIWVQQVSGEKPLRLTDDPADDWYPAFSPDGSKIAFRSEREGGGIFIVETLGGQARRLADRGASPQFSPDGAWISYVDVPASLEVARTNIYLVPVSGGPPRPLHPEFGVRGFGLGERAIWSPDGKAILFRGVRAGDLRSDDWYVAPVDGGPVVGLNIRDRLNLVSVWRNPYAWVGDHVYYSTGTTVEGVNIFRVRIDPKTYELSGAVERITSGPGTQYLASVARDGRVVFTNMTWTANTFGLAGDPDQGSVSGEPVPLTNDGMAKFFPSVSRDGSKVAFDAFGGVFPHREEARITDLATGRERSFPSRGNPFLVPLVSPDGSVLAYSDNLPDGRHTFVVSGNESAGREICASCRIAGLSSDGKRALVFGKANEFSWVDLTSGDKRRALDVTSGAVEYFALSPDDGWLALVLGRANGDVALEVVPIASGPAAEKDASIVLEDRRFLGAPAWSPDGRTLYFVSERDGRPCLWARRLDPRTKQPRGEPWAVKHFHQALYNLNLPPGDAALGVAVNKYVFFMSTINGNIYSAMPTPRR